jgi:hypothetical protein
VTTLYNIFGAEWLISHLILCDLPVGMFQIWCM